MKRTLVTMCVMLAVRAGLGQPSTQEESPDFAQLLPGLLRPIMGDRADEVTVANSRPLRAGGEWRVTVQMPAEGAEEPKPLMLTVDVERSLVCSMMGTPLRALADASAGSRAAAAEAFARECLGPWTADTVSQGAIEKGAMGIYRWANVLPGGAMTGDWWGVTVDTEEMAVIGFYQQRAYRHVGRDEVRIGANDAAASIEADLKQRAGDPGLSLRVTDAKFVLSSRFSPDHGPAWMIDFELPGGAPDTRLVDAKTGEFLSPQ